MSAEGMLRTLDPATAAMEEAEARPAMPAIPGTEAT